MKAIRIIPLLPLAASMAILSFKKKSGKGSDLGGLSTPMDDEGLEGENLSLSDLGGSVGNLSKQDKREKKEGREPDDGVLSSLPPSGKSEDRKIQEIEASVNDLKKHAESSDMTGKATKTEIESMKKDLSEINDSIKNMLNVYEAVSRQYNPFVDDETPGKMDKGASTPRELGSSPKDESGPLDRILRPDDIEEEDEFGVPGKTDSIKISPEVLGKIVPLALGKTSVPEPDDETLEQDEEDLSSDSSSAVDPYALEQVHKLVEYQLSKVYRARLIGEDLDREEVEALDRWISEFKRLGAS